MAINGSLPTNRTVPARNLRAVTPADDTDFSDGPCRSLWVGTGGDVALLARADTSSVTIANVPDGTLLPIEVKQVQSTGTPASDIVALY